MRDKQVFQKNSKKGQINDMVFVIVTITSVALTMLIAGFLYREIKPGINTNEIASNESIASYNAFAVAFPMFDLSFLFLVIALIIGLLISSLFIPSSPVFVIINIVGLIILIFLGAVFSNLYGEMLEKQGVNTTMQAVAEEDYPVMTYVMQNLPFIGAVMVMLASIIMYSKRGEFG